MPIDTNTLNREKLALTQLETILNEISDLCNEDEMFNSIIHSMAMFSRPVSDITRDLRMLNK